MWVPKAVIDWFQISKDSVSALREENSALKAECLLLKDQLRTKEINFDWIRLQINSLQNERTALMEKAYGIKIPAPEIVRTPIIGHETQMDEFSFNDVGEDLAKRLGFQVYDAKETKQ